MTLAELLRQRSSFPPEEWTESWDIGLKNLKARLQEDNFFVRMQLIELFRAAKESEAEYPDLIIDELFVNLSNIETVGSEHLDRLDMVFKEAYCEEDDYNPMERPDSFTTSTASFSSPASPSTPMFVETSYRSKIFSPITTNPDIQRFNEDIAARLSKVELREDYLNNLPKRHAKAILSLEIIDKSLAFALKNKKFHIAMELLPPGQTTRFGKMDYPELPRTLLLHRRIDGVFQLKLLSQSKLADGSKDHNLKRGGNSKLVSLEWLLNPEPNESQILNVSKKERIGANSGQQKWILEGIVREYEMMQHCDIDTITSGIFVGKDGVPAVRTSEPAAECELTTLMTKRLAPALLAKDQSYDPAQHDQSLQILHVRLIGDLLQQMLIVHEAGILHNDVKDPNILLYIINGLITAKFSDFGLSTYKSEQLSYETIEALVKEKRLELKRQVRVGVKAPEEGSEDFHNYATDLYSRAQPLATSLYASPQVAGFTRASVNLGLKLEYKSLADDFHNFASFGYELYKNDPQIKANTNEQLKDYSMLRGDQKNDIFSLGITLFMLVTGHYPTLLPNNDGHTAHLHKYQDSDGSERAQRVRYINFEHAFNEYPVLKQFEQLFRRMLAADINERISAENAVELYKTITQVSSPKAGFRML
jgi:serine/threonine protein kinase